MSVNHHGRLEGYLSKRGNKGVLLSMTWKKRYFKEGDDNKLYYSIGASSSPLGFIDLTKVTSIYSHNSIQNGFQVVTPKRVYVLKAITQEERNFWMNQLKTRCSQLEDFENVPSSPTSHVFSLSFRKSDHGQLSVSPPSGSSTTMDNNSYKSDESEFSETIDGNNDQNQELFIESEEDKF